MSASALHLRQPPLVERLLSRCSVWWGGDTGLVAHLTRPPVSVRGVTSYRLRDSCALVHTRNKLPCNVLWSTESRATFIMYSPQGKSSRLEGEDQGLEEGGEESFTSTGQPRNRSHFHSTFKASISIPSLTSKSIYPHFSPVFFISPYKLPPSSSCSLSSPSPPLPAPTRLLWFPDRPKTE